MTIGLMQACLAVAALLTGGMTVRADDLTFLVRRQMASRVGPDARYELIARALDHAVVGVSTTIGPAARSEESGAATGSNVGWYYVYLGKSGDVWSVTRASRGLPNGFREQADLVRAVPLGEFAKAVGRPEAEIGPMRERILLAASEDAALVAHFASRRSAFEQIRAIVSARPVDVSGTQSRLVASDPELGALFAEAGIDYGDRGVAPGDLDTHNGCSTADCFTLAVAFSPPEYKVGYLHILRSDTVPRMSPREYLVIRPLGEGWYFFRQN